MEDRRMPSKPTASATGARATSASTRRATSPSTPTSGPTQSIDLKELVDQLQARGIQLPILLRFTDILRHRVGEIHDAFRTAIEEYELPGQLLLRLPHQGQPAAARRRGDPRLRQAVPLRPGGRLQARAAGRAGPDQRPGHADHLQRLQGRRIHQDDRCSPARSASRSFPSSRSSPSWKRSSATPRS